MGLDQANKANIDAQKNLERYQETVCELQQQVDAEQRAQEQLSGQLQNAEKGVQMVQQEKEALANSLDQANHIIFTFVLLLSFLGHFIYYLLGY